MNKRFLIFGVLFVATIIYSQIAAGEDKFYFRSLADSYVDKGQYEQAISAYTKSIERHPNHGDIIYDRGNTYYLGEYAGHP